MKRSAGILLFRQGKSGLDVFLVHPGGPFWAKRDVGAWSIPKGEYAQDEDALIAARREFQEETGSPAEGPFIPLGDLKQPGGKIVTVWAVEQDIEPAAIKSNKFLLEWPPRSGKIQQFPEVDKAAWFPFDEALVKLLPGQIEFLTRLTAALK